MGYWPGRIAGIDGHCPDDPDDEFLDLVESIVNKDGYELTEADKSAALRMRGSAFKPSGAAEISELIIENKRWEQ